ncbi:MAG TPA: AfsR/SARP family transcriptional regulator [Mycobacteriales bacterium]|nr:AfsR/SARP family transcriptional regulator [Mycobacteriales bacterium]
MAVEVRILGPVTATIDGRAVRLGPQQRALLAVLALEPGRMLPSARLVDLLWNDSAPAAAAGTLRSHILHLRRSLEPGRPDGATAAVVVTEPGGYLLRLPPERIDAVRFERAVTEGRRALDAGRPAAAAELLRDALALWRGPALADLADRPFAVAAATRLEGLRQAALRSRIEAELALGRHRMVIGELTGMLAEAPLDEDVRRPLVLAPAPREPVRGGRARLPGRPDPAAPARAGHRAAARTATAGPAGRPGAGPTGAGRPAVPAPAGRRGVHRPGRRTGAAVRPAAAGHRHGDPGRGRSARDRQVLAGQPSGAPLAPGFTGGVLYVDLRGAEAQPLAPLTALAQFLRTLGVNNPHQCADLDTATAAYRSLLADRRTLVVLDNAADADQVRPLLPGERRWPPSPGDSTTRSRRSCRGVHRPPTGRRCARPRRRRRSGSATFGPRRTR